MSTFKIDTLFRTDKRVSEFLGNDSTLRSNFDPWCIKDYDQFYEHEIVAVFINNQIIRLIPIIARSLPFVPKHFRFAQFPISPPYKEDELEFIFDYFSIYHPHVSLEYEGKIEENNKWRYKRILNSDTLGSYSFKSLFPYTKEENQKSLLWSFHTYYSRKEMLNIKIEIKSKDELNKEINGTSNGFKETPIIQSSTGMYNYYGFTYFSPNAFYSEEQEDYVVAYSHEKDEQGNCFHKIIGIISLSRKGTIHRLYFTDVHFQYRRMGVATLLYQTLNTILNETDVLVSTELSDEGQQARLDDLRKSIVLNCKYQYQTWSEYKRLHRGVA